MSLYDKYRQTKTVKVPLAPKPSLYDQYETVKKEVSDTVSKPAPVSSQEPATKVKQTVQNILLQQPVPTPILKSSLETRDRLLDLSQRGEEIKTAPKESVLNAPTGNKESITKQIARALLPSKLEDFFGLSPKSDIVKRIEAWGDASLSYDRMRELDQTVQEVVKEKFPDGVPTVKAGYKEPVGFWGQAVEGFTEAYIGSVKPMIGTLLETAGVSPESVAWGKKQGDRAVAELVARPELSKPEDLPEFFAGGVADRRWWGRAIGSAIPSIASALAAATATAFVTKNPAAATAAAWSTTAALEKANSYRDMLNKGIPPDKANYASTAYGSIAATLEIGMGVNPGALASRAVLGKGATGLITPGLVTKFLPYLEKTIVKVPITMLKKAVGEGNEEALQQLSQNIVTGFLYDEQGLTEDVAESWAQGFAGGLPFGAVDVATMRPSTGEAPTPKTEKPKQSEELKRAIKQDVSEALKNKQSPDAIEKAIKQEFKVSAPQAERIVRETADEIGIDIPGITEVAGEEDVITGIKAAAEAVEGRVQTTVEEKGKEVSPSEKARGDKIKETIEDVEKKIKPAEKKVTLEVEAPKEGVTRYPIEVNGVKMFADLNPKFSDGMLHVEFNGPKGKTNPISETGYRSHFMSGTLESLGITDDNVQEELQKLGNKLAEEAAPERAKRAKQKAVIDKKEKRAETIVNGKPTRNRNIGGEVQAGPDSERGEAGGRGPSERGGADNERGPSMARGERDRGGPSAGERPSTPVGVADLAQKFADKLGQPLSAFHTKFANAVVNKTDKKLIDDLLTKGGGNDISKKLFADYVGIKKPTNIKGWKEAVDKYFGEQTKAPVGVEVLENEAEEKRESLGTTNEEIENIVKGLTEIKDGEVVITADEISAEELERINSYTGAGGRERTGETGRGLLDEYYTPGDVTTMVQSALGGFGIFKPGMRVLEPSAGIGAFLDDVPMDAKVDAFEINEVAARITKLNNAEATVHVQPFEALFMSDRGVKKSFEPTYDLVLGNPPYGTHRGTYKGLGEEPKIERYEEYFLKRSLDVTKEGGYVAMVIPSGFLRGGESSVKISIAQRGDLVAAYRLPNGAFPTTDIGTDVVIFKRHDYLSNRTGAKPNAQILIDDTYFTNNPANVLGKPITRKGKFGEEAAVEGSLESAIDLFYAGLNGTEAVENTTSEEEATGAQEELAKAYKPNVHKEVRSAKGKKVSWSKLFNSYNVAETIDSYGTQFWQVKGVLPKEVRESLEKKNKVFKKENLNVANIPAVTKTGSALIDSVPFIENAIALKARAGETAVVDEGYFENMRRLLPEAEIIIPEGDRKAIRFEQNGEVVGVLMPMVEFTKERLEAAFAERDKALATETAPLSSLTDQELEKTVDDMPKVQKGRSKGSIIANELTDEQKERAKQYVEEKTRRYNDEKRRKEAEDMKVAIIEEDGKWRLKILAHSRDGFPAYVAVFPKATEGSIVGALGGTGQSEFSTRERALEVAKEFGYEIVDEPTPQQKNTEIRTKTPKPPKAGELLDLSEYSLADETERALWKYVQPTGELKGNFNKKDAFFYKGEWYNRFNYLQGDIYEKLDQLEADKMLPEMSIEMYKRQKDALLSVLPKRVTIDHMSVAPNSRFATETKVNIPVEVRERQPFGRSPVISMVDKTLPLSEHFIKWIDTLPMSALGESNTYAIRGYVNNLAVRGGDKVQNESERRTRRHEGDRLFKLFLRENLEEKAKKYVEEQYNRQFNAYARPNYREVPLVGKLNSTFKDKPLEIRDVQLQGVGFLVNRGVGLLAHDVGVGKTMQSIIAINEMLARGWAKRPLIVAPNPNVYNQWIKEINELLPDARLTLLANLGGDFKGDLKSLTIPEGSISIITEEGFKRLGFKNDTYNELTKDFLDVIENPAEQTTERAKQLARAKAEEEVAKGIKGTKEERFFEDLGFDHLTVDEVHNANHIISRAKMAKEGQVSEFRNFQAKPSQFGIKTWLAAQYIQKRNNGRNVQLASATPFTNNPLEYYSILSLMARERMKRMGILNVNDFMTMFMEISTQHEFKADGSYVEKNEVRSFKNYQQFQKLLTEFIDFRDGVEAGVKRPERVSHEYVVGETANQISYKVLAQDLFMDKEHAGALKAIGELRAAAFSPFLSRYYDGPVPTADELINGSPKLKMLVGTIKQSMKDNPRAGHLIYSPVGIEYFPLIKQALVKATGLKDNEVDMITGSTPKPRRQTVQDNFNAGKIKIVLGSDAIQEGVNLQANTSDLHILSLPWNFTQVRQVIGRAWRQGNRWPRVRVNTYFTENSVDVFLSQKLQNKEKRYEESLKFKGDELDVGDINFEEMKLDLITDPVRRTELEYDKKAEELKLEIKRKEADRGYKNRRADELINAQDKVRRYQKFVDEDPEESWAKRSLEEAKEKLVEVRKRLKERGLDVENIERELNEANAEVEALETQLEALKTERETAVEKAKGERREDLTTEERETDYRAFIEALKEENKTFYEKPDNVKMLRAVGNISRHNEWVRVMDRELTKDEFEAIIIARADMMAGKEISEELLTLIKSGYKKYLDFMAETKNLEKNARKSGMPFDLTEEAGEKLIRSLFDEKEVELLFQRNNFISEGRDSAWGTYAPAKAWRHPLISVVSSEGRVQSLVLYHEAFHAYMDLFVEKSERDELLARVKANPVVATVLAVKNLVQNYKKEELAEEWLADDFARYSAGLDSMQENKNFYERLLERIRGWIRRLAGLQRVYDGILAKERPMGGNAPMILSEVQDEPVEGEEAEDVKVRAKLRGIGWKGFFHRDLEEDRKIAFEKMAQITNDPIFEEQNRDLIRKDINHLENLTAQARDIYLKDPNEFSAAEGFQIAADQRRIKKASLDKFFSETLKPYYELKGGEKEKVNKVLMQGDLEAVEYVEDELKRKNLSAEGIKAYKAARKAFNTAHEFLIVEMHKNGVPEEEIADFERERIGYMPHKWKYRYVVKHQVRRRKDGRWVTFQMDNFKSERLAREEWEQLKGRNTREDVRYSLDTLDNLEVDFFTQQRLSFDNMRSVITQAKTGDDVKKEMLDALRNMVKEKGFGRQYMKRTGVRGYEQNDVPKIMADYFAGMNGYITKMEAGKKYFKILSTIDARRQSKFHAWMRDMIAYDMGNTKEWQWARGVAFTYYLANDISFLAVNATQNFIVGTGELSKYLSPAQKLVGPEARIIKAMTDWSLGKVTLEERNTINQLLEVGELGGEMASELMGFKNNPLYTEISSRFSQVMFKSTAFVEQHVNRVPMFLAARRLFIEQGMTEGKANEKALEVSNDVHFRYGKQNRPRFERGRVGTLFVFYHYLRSFLYQLYRDASRREYAAFARKMMYTTILGGTISLPFAQTITAIFSAIFGGDDEDEEMKKEMPAWKLALTKGVPSLVGIDLSGRVGIDLISVQSIMDKPNDIRSYIGAVGTLLWVNPRSADEGGRIQQGIELMRQGRIDDALGKLAPDMFANLFKAYTGYKWGVRSFAGTPLEDADGETFKYTTWEAAIRVTGFTPTRENLAWDEKSKQFVRDDEKQQERSRLRRTVLGLVQRGQFDEARTMQEQAIEAGTINESTNYIKEFGKETFIKEALADWETGPKTAARLHELENEIMDMIYAGKETDIQNLNIRKEFAIYRTFGLKNKLVEDIRGAENNKKRVEMLLEARENMGEEKFLEFLKGGRKTVKTKEGNDSRILISDELLEEYKKAKKSKQ